MSGGIYGYSREAVRVKVKKCEGALSPEYRKFSVDPQITSFEVLQSILAKAFDLKGDFTISYRIYDITGHESYIALLSDYELDAAFLKAHNVSVATNTEPCLCLRVDLKPFEECTDDWETAKLNLNVITSHTTQLQTSSSSQEVKPAPRLHGIFNQVGRTLNMVQRAFTFGEDGSNCMQPSRPPLCDAQFRRFLDPVGQIVYAKELRSVIYYGGIDPSLRKVVWKHLLNVYPDGMTGRERMDYIKKKASEYIALRETWKTAISQGPVVGELAYTTGMVRKDVLRTDRHHPFYAGSDDNQNIASLFNILTTYALNHPKVSYCQGMSDLASPLLVTMNDEAHAYICFCALMKRLSTNFMIDGIAMTQKFTHLAEGLMYYDPEFYNYLKMYQADDLLFCYRWLLLEMKREFAFEDSLRMLEVLWSSLPADLPVKELKLYDLQFQIAPKSTPPISPLVKTPRENPYTKVCALRRQSSSISLSNYAAKKTITVKRQNHSLDETIGRTKNNIIDIKVKHQSLDDNAFVKPKINIKPQSSNDELSPPSKSLRARSVSPLEQKSDSSVILNNRLNHRLVTKSKSTSLSSSMSNLIKNTTKKTGHFKELKDRIQSAKIFSSLDRLDNNTNNSSIKEENESNRRSTASSKVVKNLNEFLNFASKNKIGDQNSKVNDFNGEQPKILLTKSSFDNSETTSSYEASFEKTTSTSADDNTFDEYSPDDSQEYFPLTTSVTRELRLELENLDRKVFGNKIYSQERLSSESNSSCGEESTDDKTATKDHGGACITDQINQQLINKKLSKSGDDIFVWENPLHQTSPNNITMPTPDEQADLELDDGDVPTIVNEVSASKTVTPIKILTVVNSVININDDNSKEVPLQSVSASSEQQLQIVGGSNLNGTTSTTITTCEEVTEAIKTLTILPPPNEFGGGNPFLMFLCITVLLQHRDNVISKGMDYNEMAMHFDKMVRKHDVVRVLNQARQMYAQYIKQHTVLAQQNFDSKFEDC